MPAPLTYTSVPILVLYLQRCMDSCIVCWGAAHGFTLQLMAHPATLFTCLINKTDDEQNYHVLINTAVGSIDKIVSPEEVLQLDLTLTGTDNHIYMFRITCIGDMVDVKMYLLTPLRQHLTQKI